MKSARSTYEGTRGSLRAVCRALAAAVGGLAALALAVVLVAPGFNLIAAASDDDLEPIYTYQTEGEFGGLIAAPFFAAESSLNKETRDGQLSGGEGASGSADGTDAADGAGASDDSEGAAGDGDSEGAGSEGASDEGDSEGAADGSEDGGVAGDDADAAAGADESAEPLEGLFADDPTFGQVSLGAGSTVVNYSALAPGRAVLDANEDAADDSDAEGDEDSNADADAEGDAADSEASDEAASGSSSSASASSDSASTSAAASAAPRKTTAGGSTSSGLGNSRVASILTNNVLTSDGKNYLVTVVHGPDAGVPQNARLDVREMEGSERDEYASRAEEALGYEEGSAQRVRLFDIKILAENGEKVQIAAPVSVRISLVGRPSAQNTSSNAGTAASATSDASGSAAEGESGESSGSNAAAPAAPDAATGSASTASADGASGSTPTNPLAPIFTDPSADTELQVVHFPDDSSQPDVLDTVSSDGETVSFKAEGFSAYAVVEGPEATSLGWGKVLSVDELTSHDEGVYLGHPDGFFYQNTLASDGSRTGIKKTTPKKDTPPATASRYFFEPAEGDSMFYVYCLAPDGETRQYVMNGGNNSLTFADSESGKTAFAATVDAQGRFRLHNGAWYWNMQGGANGTRFCSYNNAGDANNNIYIWYEIPLGEDPYELDGLTYGLMNWNGGVAGKALMATGATSGAADAAADATTTTLPAKALTVLAKQTNDQDRLFVPNDSEIDKWTFNWLGEDLYTLSTTSGGKRQYLQITPDGAALTTSVNAAGQVQVVPGTGIHAGEICLKSGDVTLTYSGNVDAGFNVNGESGSEWLHLVTESNLTADYFMARSATKVSVSDPAVTTGSKVIVYTRAWNEAKLRYDFYAVNGKGELVPCYESGDSIEWLGGIVNEELWQFTEYTTDAGAPTFYYELYNEYQEKFLAPQVTGGQIVSDSTIGINMDGRRSGQYYSTILAWDDAHYSFAGLKVENGAIVSCPKSQALDFYFAVMEEQPADDVLHTVETLDNAQFGITMKVKDFSNRAVMSNFLGNDAGGAVTTLQQGLLSSQLGENGYPTAKGGSLGDLFDGATEVNHLFIDSIYRSSGYYEFDSSQNFATLVDPATGKQSGDFTVYRELGSYDSGGNKATLKHGQFFPFNSIQAGQFATVNGKNLYSTTAKLLPNSDPRKNEQLYLIKDTNCYFGVELEASFVQTPDGLDAWGHDIIYEFTGDDDFWLYVDGKLVIDLGGIHSAVPGSVNFRTGDVNVNGKPTTLRVLFEAAYRDENPKASDAEVAKYLDGIFQQNADGQYVFKDDSPHTMRIFYMERGAGASNLHMRFNLASVRPGTVQMTKQLSGVDAMESVLAEFPYQIRYTQNGEEHLLANVAAGSAAGAAATGGKIAPETTDYVYYKDTTTPVKFLPELQVDGVTYQNVFMVKPGETIEINFPVAGESTYVDSYNITECWVDTKVYGTVSANGQKLSGEPVEGHSSRSDFAIDDATTQERATVTFDNQVNPDALRTLTFTKLLFDADGTTAIGGGTDGEPDATTFSFRLLLGTEFDSQPALANMHTYHVKDPEGFYCKWDAVEKTMSPTEFTDYTALTDQQKQLVSFSTSVYGSISMIPSGYTVEVRDVLAGTRFGVQERPGEIPDGYSFQRYTYYPDAADEKSKVEGEPGDEAAEAGVTDVVSAGKDPHVDVRNLKGWGLRMYKRFTDAPFMESRAPAYFAVFVRDGDAEDAASADDGASANAAATASTAAASGDSASSAAAASATTAGDSASSEAAPAATSGDTTSTIVFSGEDDSGAAATASTAATSTSTTTTAAATSGEDDIEDLTLVPDTVRQLAYGENTLYWYFLKLPVAVPFDRYEIREVELAGAEVDDDGNVTSYDSIRAIPGNGQVQLSGRQKGQADEELEYNVRYERGVPEDGSNVRVDNVVNDRPGIMLRKVDWSGNPLEGATFNLVDNADDSGSVLGAFTSGEDGVAAIMFLGEGKEYTLTEVESPRGYYGLQKPLTLSMQDGELVVSGIEPEYYEIEREHSSDDGVVAALVVKNRPFTLQVVKQGVSGTKAQPLGGAHFELHREATVDGKTAMEFDALNGFEDLVSAVGTGVVPKVDETLRARAYQLVETQPPDGYARLAGNVRFAITQTGKVELVENGQAKLSSQVADDGTMEYTITVTNRKAAAALRIVKVSADGQPLEGVHFKLTGSGIVDEQDLVSQVVDATAEPEAAGTAEATRVVMTTNANVSTGESAYNGKAEGAGASATEGDITAAGVNADAGTGETGNGEAEGEGAGASATKGNNTVGAGNGSAAGEGSGDASATSGDAVVYENDAMPDGTFILTEIQPPRGYEALAGPVEITVATTGGRSAVKANVNGKEVGTSGNSTVTATVNGEEVDESQVRVEFDAAANTWTLAVVNRPGTALPLTGGPGTTALYALGLLLLAAGLTLALKSRRRHTR